jgi:BirA family biotin operon repressor/biotin-[acetyl-CoA-carboxylase] ligase
VSGQPPAADIETPTRIGHPRLHLRRTGSTNERARELAFAGAPHGALVTASEQTAGRGRHGRRWSAPAGSALLASLLLRDVPPLLPLIAAVAVCDVAGTLKGTLPAGGHAGERSRIKWPNDVVVEASDSGALAKLAGILVEGRPQQGWAVLGIGLNVAVRLHDLPAELQPGPDGRAPGGGMPAATLGLTPADVEAKLAQLLDVLARRLREPEETTLTAWRARDALLGREIAWGTHGTDAPPADGADGADNEAPWTRGTAQGIDATGRLIVELADGTRTTIGAGEVHLRGIA